MRADRQEWYIRSKCLLIHTFSLQSVFSVCLVMRERVDEMSLGGLLSPSKMVGMAFQQSLSLASEVDCDLSK